MKKKILILGGSGLLGSFLNKNLKKKYSVIATSSKSSVNKYYKLNALNQKKLIKLINFFKPNIIINCIGFTDVDRCEIEKKIAIDLNVLIINNVADILKSKKNIHLIHISTDQVYNNNRLKIKNMEKNTNPINYYGLTKLIGEKKALEYNQSTVLRTNFFGKSISKKKSYSDYIIHNLKKNKKIRVASNIYFNPVSMNYLLKTIHRIIIKKAYGLYNLGSKDFVSKYNFVKKIAKLKNFNLKQIISFKSGSKHSRPLGMVMSIKKIEKKLNFKIPKLDKMLNEI